jgi:lysylphosphatidylglycerol synthetase-like protein (DUF2156 family)
VFAVALNLLSWEIRLTGRPRAAIECAAGLLLGWLGLAALAEVFRLFQWEVRVKGRPAIATISALVFAAVVSIALIYWAIHRPKATDKGPDMQWTEVVQTNDVTA